MKKITTEIKHIKFKVTVALVALYTFNNNDSNGYF